MSRDVERAYTVRAVRPGKVVTDRVGAGGPLRSKTAGAGKASGPHHPYQVTELCRTVFADVDAVVRAIAKQAGHLPDRPSSRRTSS